MNAKETMGCNRKKYQNLQTVMIGPNGKDNKFLRKWKKRKRTKQALDRKVI